MADDATPAAEGAEPRAYYPTLLVASILLGVTPSGHGLTLGDVLPTVLVATSVIVVVQALAEWVVKRPAVVGLAILPLVPYLYLTGIVKQGWSMHMLLLEVPVFLIVGMRLPRGLLQVGTTLLNLFGAFFLFFALRPLVMAELTAPSVSPPPALVLELPEAPPSILHIMLDGYGDPAYLDEAFDCRPELPAALAARGFVLPEGVRSNYPQTLFSFTSMLHMDHLSIPDDVDARRYLRQRLHDNTVTSALAAHGYTIESYPSEYSPLDLPGDRYAPWFSPGFYGYLVMSNSLMRSASELFGQPGNRIIHAAHLRRMTYGIHGAATVFDGPTYRFLHLIAPHPPFTIHPDGSYAPDLTNAVIHDGSHWAELHEGEGDYAAGYCDKAMWLDSQLLPLVDEVLAGAPDTVIVIHGDHGPGRSLEWQDMDKTNMVERYGTLLAVKAPADVQGQLYPGITLVNVFPTLLNGLFHANIPPQPDAAYWAGWSTPGTLHELTDQLAP